MGLRVCIKCNIEKSEDSFHTANVCKACNTLYHKQYSKTYVYNAPPKAGPNDSSPKICSKCGQYTAANAPGWDKNTCPECKRQARRKYVENNKELEKERSRNYYKTNTVKAKAATLKWKGKNPGYGKNYYKANKDAYYTGALERRKADPNKYRAYQNAYRKSRMAQDSEYRILQSLRSRLRNAVLRQDSIKTAHTIELLGCPTAWLKLHLESKFQPGMTWNNYGKNGWVIDHIIPCSAFDMNKQEDQEICFNWVNLQPLWYSDNLKKSDFVSPGVHGRNISLTA